MAGVPPYPRGTLRKMLVILPNTNVGVPMHLKAMLDDPTVRGPTSICIYGVVQWKGFSIDFECCVLGCRPE